jgi:CheY-like chemotaxis protein
MRLSLPADAHEKSQTYQPSEKQKPVDTASDLEKALIPPIFSILVVSEQPYSRIAISHHIRVTLPKNIPNKITCVGTFLECSKLIAGEDPVVFTHLVISLPEHSEIITLISHILEKPIHSQTTILILTNPNQRTAIIQNASEACDKLGIRLQFIYKPIKPSRFGDIFDPAKERDASMDRYRGLAQQVVETQKKVFSHLEHEVGNKGYKVLLVEDNRVNQKVLLRFLAKVGLEVETASDGEECVEKVFSKGPGHYGLILCDLHMPRKDGFQATAEIRQWETEKKVPHVPIVALSANVMSDVADKCATAGFSRYVTKPVDFKELSATIKDLLPSASTSLPSNEDHELKKMNQMETRRVEDDKGSVPRITKTERVSGEHERPGDDVPGDKVLGEGR